MSEKSKKSKKNLESNATEFKIWCIRSGIEMKDIRRDTKLSIGCIHALWNVGKASESTIKLLSLVYDINENKLKRMITTFVNKKTKTKTK
jgi:hypothetical protein